MLLYPEVRRFVCHGSFCFWTVKVHRVARRPLFVRLWYTCSNKVQASRNPNLIDLACFVNPGFCFHEHRSRAKQTTKLTNHESRCLSQPNHHNSNLHCHSGDWLFERSSYLFFLTCVNEERSICREYPFRHQSSQEVMRRGMHEGKKLLRRDFHVAGINPSNHVRGRSATATCIHRG